MFNAGSDLTGQIDPQGQPSRVYEFRVIRQTSATTHYQSAVARSERRIVTSDRRTPDQAPGQPAVPPSALPSSQVAPTTPVAVPPEVPQPRQQPGPTASEGLGFVRTKDCAGAADRAAGGPADPFQDMSSGPADISCWTEGRANWKAGPISSASSQSSAAEWKEAPTSPFVGGSDSPGDTFRKEVAAQLPPPLLLPSASKAGASAPSLVSQAWELAPPAPPRPSALGVARGPLITGIETPAMSPPLPAWAQPAPPGPAVAWGPTQPWHTAAAWGSAPPPPPGGAAHAAPPPPPAPWLQRLPPRAGTFDV